MKAVIYTGDVTRYLGNDITITNVESLKKVLDYVNNYKKALESGVSYHDLCLLAKEDIELYLDIKTKLDMLDMEYAVTGFDGVEFLNNYHEEVMREKYNQTATDSLEDAKCRSLALRLAKRK